MNFVKRYWLFFILAALAAFLAFLWAKAEKNKDLAPTPLPQIEGITFPSLGAQVIPENSSITIEGEAPATEVSVFKVASKTITSDEAQKIAQTLGLSEEPKEVEDPKTGKQLIWNKEATFLFVSTNPLDILYGIDPAVKEPATSGTLPSRAEGASNLQNLLTKLGLATTEKSQVRTGEIQDGKFLEVGLDAVLEGATVLGLNTHQALASAWFDKSGEIFRFTFQNSFASPEKQKTYPAKTLADIQKTIKSEGRIVKLGDVEIPTFVPTAISINRITNALLFIPGETSLYPIFALEGQAQTSEGQQPITIYIPAPKSDYLE